MVDLGQEKMACNKSFCSNYMLLSPEKAGLVDLVCFLFSSNIYNRKFVDVPKGTKMPFAPRWIIFLTVVAQILLRLVAKPVAWLGNLLEQWLNLLHMNTNIFVLIYNLVTGQVIGIPDETSAKYLSVLAFLDLRQDLDENIAAGDSRYNPHLSIMAAKVAYENKAFIESTVTDHWKMDFVAFYDFWNDYQKKATTQGFLFRKDENTDTETIVVAFRGTSPFDTLDWVSDVDLSWYEFPGLGKVHAGFLKALGQQKLTGWPKNLIQIFGGHDYAYYTVRGKLKELLKKNDKAKFIVTGHSLGGALAILFPAILAYHGETSMLERLDGVYTFGQPRVGNEQFGKFMEDQINNNLLPNYYRTVYCNDIVPRVPSDNSVTEFKHFGTCAYFNSFFKGKTVDEAPNKNYFSILWLIPKIINSIWELIRSFIKGCVWGSDYKETGLMQLLRVVCLLFGGVPAHCPPDYVDSTRLASTELYGTGGSSTEGKTKNKWATELDPLV
ncbi:triacylglycerol lipase OBL1-like [Coffea arabica]|uniref:Triacylglycerol lipase OBL1-like n=1 Tax=Coffea arabica TaxID=13443 RepID=A0A6P6T7T8_COFAR|nr:uncharacterized protein LOC113698414 [Coffea arabica]